MAASRVFQGLNTKRGSLQPRAGKQKCAIPLECAFAGDGAVADIHVGVALAVVRGVDGQHRLLNLERLPGDGQLQHVVPKLLRVCRFDPDVDLRGAQTGVKTLDATLHSDAEHPQLDEMAARPAGT